MVDELLRVTEVNVCKQINSTPSQSQINEGVPFLNEGVVKYPKIVDRNNNMVQITLQSSQTCVRVM